MKLTLKVSFLFFFFKSYLIKIKNTIYNTFFTNQNTWKIYMQTFMFVFWIIFITTLFKEKTSNSKNRSFQRIQTKSGSGRSRRRRQFGVQLESDMVLQSISKRRIDRWGRAGRSSRSYSEHDQTHPRTTTSRHGDSQWVFRSFLLPIRIKHISFISIQKWRSTRLYLRILEKYLRLLNEERGSRETILLISK